MHLVLIDVYHRQRLMLEFQMPKPKKFMTKWCQLADRSEHLRKFVRIALV